MQDQATSGKQQATWNTELFKVTESDLNVTVTSKKNNFLLQNLWFCQFLLGHRVTFEIFFKVNGSARHVENFFNCPLCQLICKLSKIIIPLAPRFQFGGSRNWCLWCRINISMKSNIFRTKFFSFHAQVFVMISNNPNINIVTNTFNWTTSFSSSTY